jgi:hypothetical protein
LVSNHVLLQLYTRLKWIGHFFLYKLETDPLMVAKLKAKTHLSSLNYLGPIKLKFPKVQKVHK